MNLTVNVDITGICSNIRNYLTAHQSKSNTIGSNWMYLTYIPGKDSTNRRGACGTNSKGKTNECADLKRSLWPKAVQLYKNRKKNKNKNPKDQDYTDMSGYTDNISCDEFPCRCTADFLSSHFDAHVLTETSSQCIRGRRYWSCMYTSLVSMIVWG